MPGNIDGSSHMSGSPVSPTVSGSPVSGSPVSPAVSGSIVSGAAMLMPVVAPPSPAVVSGSPVSPGLPVSSAVVSPRFLFDSSQASADRPRGRMRRVCVILVMGKSWPWVSARSWFR
jgi:hypothetical protein